MDKAIIAIVDSGISLAESSLSIVEIINIIAKREDTYSDLNGHGTMCAKTVNFVNPNNTYYIIKCLDRNLHCSSEELLVALESLLSIKVDIINLSLATNSYLYYKEFKTICDNIKKQGKIIIASVSKEGRYSIPAVLPSVIGVEGTSIGGHCKALYNAGKKIQCTADSSPLIIKYNSSFSVFAGHSKATACMSGIVSRKLFGLKDEENINGISKNIDTREECLKSKIDKLRVILINEIGDSYLETSKSLLKSGINKWNVDKILKKIEDKFEVDLPEVITLDSLESEKAIIKMIAGSSV